MTKNSELTSVLFQTDILIKPTNLITQHGK